MSPITKTSGYFESFDGTRIYYETRGQGKPLVFVYGIACLINHWHPQLNFFSHHYQTVIFDFRGHHFSEVPENKKNLSIDALAQDLLALCDHLNIQDATFIGHSFGCEVLMAAYLKRPSLFKGLGFVSAFFSNPFAALLSGDQLQNIFSYVKKAYNAAPSVMNSIWKYGVTNPVSVFLSSLTGGFNLQQTAVKDIEIYAQGVANIDVRVFLTLFEELTQHNGLPDLVSVNVPTLVIAGERDSLTPMHMQDQIAESLSDTELYKIPNGSHCVQLDFPDIVNAKIEGFLKKLNY
jgi:pimeloyl-ACP methyl ester carboxylesterase